MGLTRNQIAILTVLARDDQRRQKEGGEWVGRTLGSIVNDVSRLMSTSTAYANVQSLESVGLVAMAFKSGPATQNRLLRFVSVTPDGLEALENERILIAELGSTNEEASTTIGDASLQR